MWEGCRAEAVCCSVSGSPTQVCVEGPTGQRQGAEDGAAGGPAGPGGPCRPCQPRRLSAHCPLPMAASTCKQGSNLEGENLRKLPPGGLGHVGRGTCCQQVSSAGGRARLLCPGVRGQRAGVTPAPAREAGIGRARPSSLHIPDQEENGRPAQTEPSSRGRDRPALRARGGVRATAAAGCTSSALSVPRTRPPPSLADTHNAPSTAIGAPGAQAGGSRSEARTRRQDEPFAARRRGRRLEPLSGERDILPPFAARATGAHPPPPAVLPTFRGAGGPARLPREGRGPRTGLERDGPRWAEAREGVTGPGPNLRQGCRATRPPLTERFSPATATN